MSDQRIVVSVIVSVGVSIDKRRPSRAGHFEENRSTLTEQPAGERTIVSFIREDADHYPLPPACPQHDEGW